MSFKHKKRRTHTPSKLAKWMALLPASCALLYPLYLAAQLYTDVQHYTSSSLPAAFDGLTVTFVSDIHFGSLFSKERVEHLVQQVNALKSDIILLGGDYGETSQGALDFFALNPRFEASIGVFATVGNHDRTMPDSNLSRITQAMAENGVTPLVNDAWVLERENTSLAICSVDDFYNGFPDLERVSKLVADADFVLFMPHTPDILPECEKMGESFYHLALCGHTHGGQVALFNRPILSSSTYGARYNSGWYKENGADIFVSTGVGTSAFPVRLGTKPQIHQFFFKSSKP
ncbi:MAG: metallophosphoesterase [Clostridia bacterium]|nr:metallophosphoesterase [Clostridia bacterium]